jgi:hypothetical protein
VVFQIGTSNAVQALQAANLVSGDIKSRSPSVVK